MDAASSATAVLVKGGGEEEFGPVDFVSRRAKGGPHVVEFVCLLLLSPP